MTVKEIRAHRDWIQPNLKLASRAAKYRDTPGFKVIVAGSRTFDVERVKDLVREHWRRALTLFGSNVSHVISGACPTGADRAGEELALELTGREAVRFPAEWSRLGKAAGPSRNIDMATCANALFLVWDGRSRGSRHMLALMESRDRPVYEIEISSR